MPVPNYSLCKGHPSQAAVRGGNGHHPSHLHVTLQAGAREFDIAYEIEPVERPDLPREGRLA
jgi:hypothetical protein